MVDMTSSSQAKPIYVKKNLGELLTVKAFFLVKQSSSITTYKHIQIHINILQTITELNFVLLCLFQDTVSTNQFKFSGSGNKNFQNCWSKLQT